MAQVPQGEGGGAGPLTTRSQGEAEGHVGGPWGRIIISVSQLTLYCYFALLLLGTDAPYPP